MSESALSSFAESLPKIDRKSRRRLTFLLISISGEIFSHVGAAVRNEIIALVFSPDGEKTGG
jgi:hypothetical protein